MQFGLVVFGVPNVLAARGENLDRDLALRVHGIAHHDFAPQIQRLQQARRGRDLILFALDQHLHEHQPFTGQVCGQQMHSLCSSSHDGAAQGLAIHGDQLAQTRLRLSSEHALEQSWNGADQLTQLKHASKGVVTGHRGTCELECLHQAGATPVHPVSDARGRILATQFGQHQQTEQQG